VVRSAAPSCQVGRLAGGQAVCLKGWLILRALTGREAVSLDIWLVVRLSARTTWLFGRSG